MKGTLGNDSKILFKGRARIIKSKEKEMKYP